MNNINHQFQVLQAIQVALLTCQGIMLLTSGVNELSLLIWTLLGIAALLQVVIIIKAPKKIEVNQSVDRTAMIKLRSFATVPYILIILGILFKR